MALSANTDYPVMIEEAMPTIPVAATTHVYKGAAIGLSSGYARGFTAGDAFRGIAYEEADNSSGAAGAKSVRLYGTGSKIQLPVTGVTAVTDVGKIVYASADDTFTLTYGATYGVVGVVCQYVSTGYAWVEIKPMDEVLEVVTLPLISSTAVTSGWIVYPYPVTIVAVGVMFDVAPIASTGGHVLLDVGTTAADPDEVVDAYDVDAATADVMHAPPIVSGAIAANTPIRWRLGAAATIGVGGGLQLVIRRNK